MRSALVRFDTGVTRTVQGLPEWLRPTMAMATLLGQPVAVVAIGAFSALVARHQGQPKVTEAFLLVITACGLNGILKYFLRRTRPDTLYVTRMRFKSYSFPSGHAFGTVVVYGLLAYLAAHHWPGPWNYAAAVAVSLMLILVGLSRVYLGAHFPTDVLGGWALSLIVLAAIIGGLSP